MFFKCDERSLSMLIVPVCVRECQFALNIKDSAMKVLKEAHVHWGGMRLKPQPTNINNKSDGC